MSVLIFNAMIWGGSYVAEVFALRYIPPLAFNALSLTLAAIVLIPLFFVGGSLPRTKEKWKKFILFSLILGLSLSGTMTCIQLGIYFSKSAGQAGFITSLYIVIVPFLGFFIGKKPSLQVIIASIICLGGLYLLAFQGGDSFNIGSLFLLGAAFSSSIHLLAIERALPVGNPLHISASQTIIAAIINWCIYFIGPAFTIQQVGLTIWPLLYSGILSGGIAFTLQIFGQRYIPPVPTALTLSLESIFAAIGGYLILHEVMSTKAIIGCALMFCGTILAQLPSPKKKAKDRTLGKERFLSLTKGKNLMQPRGTKKLHLRKNSSLHTPSMSSEDIVPQNTSLNKSSLSNEHVSDSQNHTLNSPHAQE